MRLTISLPPLVTTGTASGITAGSAILNGTVSPNGFATTARFEYGLTDSYGSTADVTLAPDNGTSEQSVSASISGLQAGTTYHYRLTATNSEATGQGADMTFVTTARQTLQPKVPEGFESGLGDWSVDGGCGQWAHLLRGRERPIPAASVRGPVRPGLSQRSQCAADLCAIYRAGGE